MKKPIGRKEDIITQEVNGEVLIYDLKKNKAYCLNETSSLVWKACDGNKSVAEIGATLGRNLNSAVNEDLIWLALDQLKKANLISNAEEIPNDYQGMSRRAVIKKVGLTSMIALPIVTSMIAPSAAHAASPGACIMENDPVRVMNGDATSFANCQAQLEAQCCMMNGLMETTFDSGPPTMCSGVC